MYAASKTAGNNASGSVAPAHSAPGYKKPPMSAGGGGGGVSHNNGKMRFNKPPHQAKPQPLHYCEVCKISCAGPQTYREHLEGQKHKKRQAGLKLVSIGGAGNQGSRGNTMHCSLCDVTCTGVDAYAAHVRGSKHQKVVKLHQKLGKPIPEQATPMLPQAKPKINFVSEAKPSMVVEGNTGVATPVAAPVVPVAPGIPATVTPVTTSVPMEVGVAQTAAIQETTTPAAQYPPQSDIKPVGMEYIEEIRDEAGTKIISFNCKLCDCKFNDPNAKEMHMKGRRHRLQYKKKVQPDLVVDLKPSPRRLKIAEAKSQREMWNPRFQEEGTMHDEKYWESQRRFEEEVNYGSWMQRMAGRGGDPGMGPNGYPVRPGMERRVESSDDRHMVAKHAEIYPKVEELQVIQRIVSHTERALKFVSDALTSGGEKKPEVAAEGGKAEESKEAAAGKPVVKEDGRDNQMFSFQKDADGIVRVLKGVMRVGLLAKGKWDVSRDCCCRQYCRRRSNFIANVVLCPIQKELELKDSSSIASCRRLA